MISDHHDSWCKWPDGPPCRSFSTDGTRLGADIAHTMGTTDEEVIKAGKAPNDEGYPPDFVSDVQAEQVDWEEACDTCSGYGCAECTGEPGPPVDHERPSPYPASKCDWN